MSGRWAKVLPPSCSSFGMLNHGIVYYKGHNSIITTYTEIKKEKDGKKRKKEERSKLG